MTNHFSEADVTEGVARAIAAGELKIVGYDDDGEAMLELTKKGRTAAREIAQRWFGLNPDEEARA